MPNTITLNGKIYETTGRAYEEVTSAKREVRLTIGRKTSSQDFSFTDSRWQIKILVWLTAPASGWGAKADLETAYGLAYCSFVDIDGTDQGNVFIEGDLDQLRNYALVDTTAPYEVSLSLRKRVV